MDKEILSYLDKVGSYVQGASEHGFKVYVHGVFVESLISVIIGLSLIVLSAIIFIVVKRGIDKSKKENISGLLYEPKYKEPTFLGLVFIGGSVMLLVVSVVIIFTNITGVFAPDYVAIKQILHGVKNN